MAKPETLTFSGMNNKATDTALPDGKARVAVNVLFDDANQVIMPRPGSTLRYAGDCQWLFECDFITLFVEGGSLKSLSSANVATTLTTGIGTSRVYYTLVGDTVYWANETAKGKIRNGVNSEWGTQRPPRQPDCIPIATGGLHAGDYRVALTWIADEESGTGMGKRVTVAAGGGIRVTNLPTPPSYVTKYAIWISSVNGKDMYLYGEYAVSVAEVYIGRLTAAGFLPDIKITTQFGYNPLPQGLICAHYGRIYYTRGKRVYWTANRRYGLQFANSFWIFDSDVQTIVSVPNVLYIGTQAQLYKIVNIDGEGAPVIEELQHCGSVKGSETYAPDGTAYFMTDRGMIRATPEGLTELTFKDNAIPLFGKGTMSVREFDGLSYLIFTGQDGVQNPLANNYVNISELARGCL
jgi:hypothetical protein